MMKRYKRRPTFVQAWQYLGGELPAELGEACECPWPATREIHARRIDRYGPVVHTGYIKQRTLAVQLNVGYWVVDHQGPNDVLERTVMSNDAFRENYELAE